jgi:hypothetical protein
MSELQGSLTRDRLRNEWRIPENDSRIAALRDSESRQQCSAVPEGKPPKAAQRHESVM